MYHQQSTDDSALGISDYDNCVSRIIDCFYNHDINNETGFDRANDIELIPLLL